MVFGHGYNKEKDILQVELMEMMQLTLTIILIFALRVSAIDNNRHVVSRIVSHVSLPL